MFITSSLFEVNRNGAPRSVENSTECKLFTGPCNKEGASEQLSRRGNRAIASFFQGSFSELVAITHQSLPLVCENRGQIAVGKAVRATVQQATQKA
jgi:hypothetical protein